MKAAFDISQPHQKYAHVNFDGEGWGGSLSADHFKGSYDVGVKFSVILPGLMEDDSLTDYFHPFIGVDINLIFVQLRADFWLDNRDERRRGLQKADGGDRGSSAEAEDLQKVP